MIKSPLFVEVGLGPNMKMMGGYDILRRIKKTPAVPVEAGTWVNLPPFVHGMLNDNVSSLLASREINLCLCRRISDAAKHLNAELNQLGFSEKWDMPGLFSSTTKTIYLPKDGWEEGEMTVYSEEQRRTLFAHETGHAIDFCLDWPSHSEEFERAWAYDIANSFPFDPESKPNILHRLMDPDIGQLELWANFFQFALIGQNTDPGSHYFPKALEVFNRQCTRLNIPKVTIVIRREQQEYDGRTLWVDSEALSRDTPQSGLARMRVLMRSALSRVLRHNTKT